MKRKQTDLSLFFKSEVLTSSAPPKKKKKPVLHVKAEGIRWGGTEMLRKDDLLITRIWLNCEHTSWIDAFFLTDADMKKAAIDFDSLWALHPKEYGNVIICGKQYKTPRFEQSYGNDYWYAGLNHKSLSIPKELKGVMELAKSHGFGFMYGDKGGYNQVVMNWYLPKHCIGAHSDKQAQLQKSPLGETTIWSLTVLKDPRMKARTFRMKFKKKADWEKKNLNYLDVRLDHGLVLVMGGLCQRTHTHQVVKLTSKKTKQDVSPRVNITLRVFKS